MRNALHSPAVFYAHKFPADHAETKKHGLRHESLEPEHRFSSVVCLIEEMRRKEPVEGIPTTGEREGSFPRSGEIELLDFYFYFSESLFMP